MLWLLILAGQALFFQAFPATLERFSGAMGSVLHSVLKVINVRNWNSAAYIAALAAVVVVLKVLKRSSFWTECLLALTGQALFFQAFPGTWTRFAAVVGWFAAVVGSVLKPVVDIRHWEPAGFIVALTVIILALIALKVRKKSDPRLQWPLVLIGQVFFFQGFPGTWTRFAATIRGFMAAIGSVLHAIWHVVDIRNWNFVGYIVFLSILLVVLVVIKVLKERDDWQSDLYRLLGRRRRW
jgi:hypothetical protein